MFAVWMICSYRLSITGRELPNRVRFLSLKQPNSSRERTGKSRKAKSTRTPCSMERCQERRISGDTKPDGTEPLSKKRLLA